MEILTNFPLLASFAAIFFAQFIKVPIYFVVSKMGLAACHKHGRNAEFTLSGRHGALDRCSS